MYFFQRWEWFKSNDLQIMIWIILCATFDLNQSAEDLWFLFKSFLNDFDFLSTLTIRNHLERLLGSYLLPLCNACSAIVSSLCDVTDCCWIESTLWWIVAACLLIKSTVLYHTSTDRSRNCYFMPWWWWSLQSSMKMEPTWAEHIPSKLKWQLI